MQPDPIAPRRTRKSGIGVTLCALLASGASWANPEGGQVVAGQAQIANGAAQVQVRQSSERAVINWDSFSIAAGETTQFVQPSSSSVTLNRVTGQDASVIAGQLRANGHVMLVNRNGIAFTSSARVDVGGLTATTADITDGDFMAGRHDFSTPAPAGSAVSNAGAITVKGAGLAALVAPSVRNTGTITARLGRIELAAGQRFTLDLYGDGLVELAVPEPGDAQALQIENSGRLIADGGHVELSAAAAEGVLNNVINHEGLLQARTVRAENGQLVFGAVSIDAAGASVQLAAAEGAHTSIDVSSAQVGAAGGTVQINGGAVSLGADIVASGSAGGTVAINADWMSQGGSIVARGTDGAGGSVALEIAGSITAPSGVAIDVSGRSAGGAIRVVAGREVLTSGQYLARGERGAGGQIDLTARGVRALSATFDASGAYAGGRIRLGGEARGGYELAMDELPNAEQLWLNDGTRVLANAFGLFGNGGQVVFWSEQNTILLATVEARPGSWFGAGGHVEVSSSGSVKLTDRIASGRGNRRGTLLLDPKNIVIGDVETASYQFQMLMGFDYLNDSENVGSLAASDGSGTAVALDGNRLAIGAWGDDGATNGFVDSGAVRLFVFDDDQFTGGRLVGTIGRGYTGGKNINLPALAADDRFGISASLDGMRLAVGAHLDDGGSVAVSNAGAAYLFTFTDLEFGGGQHAGTIGRGYTAAADPQNIDMTMLEADDDFGISVALDGNRLAVAAYADNGSGNTVADSGAVYLFTFSDSSFNGGQHVGTIGRGYTGDPQNFNLTPLETSDLFGMSVSLDGNRLAVGAHADDGSGVVSNTNNRGAIYLFTFSDAAFNTPQHVGTIGSGYTGGNNINVALQNLDIFGRGVALDGNRLAVGAASDDGNGAALVDSGAVYLFTFADAAFGGGALAGVIGSGYTAGTRDMDLTKLAASDHFGIAVSLDGTRLAVGAYLDDGSGDTLTDSGAVYLFSFDDLLFNGGRHTATIGKSYGAAPGLDVTRLQASDYFGYGVSLDGNRLAVGTYADDSSPNNVTNSGAVYLFTFEDDSFNGALLEGIIGRGYTGGKNVNVPTLVASDNFGVDVSLDGNRLAVSANGDDGSGTVSNTNNYGAVYLFTFADAAFTAGQHIGTIGSGYTTALDPQNIPLSLNVADSFGASLSLDGNRLAVGAHGDDGFGNAVIDSGAAYLFTFTDAAFSGGALAAIVGRGYTGGKNVNVTALVASDVFGIGVSLDGNRLAVGAYGDDSSANNVTDTGAVYLFTFADAAFTGGQLAGIMGRGYLTSSDPQNFNITVEASDYFGIDVSLDGNRLAVGAHGDEAFGNTVVDAGAVYLFTFTDAAFNGAALQATLGAGYTGGKNFDVANLGASDHFGRSLSLNGNRLAVGATGDDGNGNAVTDSGAVYLFTFGDDTFTSPELAGIIGKSYGAANGFDVPGLQPLDQMGYGVSLDGNRLALGARLADGAGNLVANSGAVYLFTFADESFNGVSLAGIIGHGYTGGNNINLATLAADDHFGISVSLDGNRLAVGAFVDDGATGAPVDTGAVYLFTFSDAAFTGGQHVGTIGRGYTTALDPQNIDVPGLAASDQFGRSVSLDGTRLAVSAWSDDSDLANSGAVYLFTFADTAFNGGQLAGTIGRGFTTVADPQNINMTQLAVSDLFGSGVSLDGNRLAIGAYGDDGNANNVVDAGAVYLFTFTDAAFNGGQLVGIVGHGYPTSDPQNMPVTTLTTVDNFGSSVSLDGRRLAVGAFGDDGFGNILTDAGAVYVFTYTDDAFNGGKLEATIGKGYTGGNNIDINNLGDSDFFGSDVSLNGGRMAVGAIGDDGSNNPAGTAGAVYLFGAGPGVSSYFYNDDPGSDVTVSAAAVANLLETQDLIFQANNDITVASPILVDNPGGDGARLTLQAGRSVLLNANITLDNGSLLVIANDDLVSEVVDAYRDPGAAVISMAPGVVIDAGTGIVEMYLRGGTGKTNFGSGAITLGSITAGTIQVVNEGVSAGSDVVIRSGSVLAASGTGDAIVLAAASGGTFINNAGAGALSTPNGRWLIYSADPALTTLAGLTYGFKRYNRTYAANPPGTLSETGNGVIYSIAPVLTITATDASRVYGDANSLGYGVTGFIDGDSASTADALSGLPSLTTAATAGSAVGSYAIDAELGALLSAMGYQFAFIDGTLTVTARAITLSADATARIYGDADPSLGVSVAGGSLASGDTLGEVAGTLARTAGEDVGLYDVLLGSGVKAGNYTISYIADNDAFSITPRPITLMADPSDRIYGNADPALSVSISAGTLGLSDTLAQVTGSLSREAGENVGLYDVLLGSGARAGNYAITYTVDNNAFSITQRAISLAADLVSRTYGDADPALTASLTAGSLASGDTLAEITGSLTREAGENVGTYDVALGSGIKAGNYAVTHAVDNNAFSITQRAISLAADLISRIYGDADSALAASITAGSLASSDTLAEITGALTREVGENVGAYDVLLGTGAKAGNYAITYTADNNAFSITQRAISLAADLISRIYGDADPALMASITAGSLASGDTLAEVTGALTREAGENVGAYDVLLGSGSKAGNYAITYTVDNNAFVIAQRAIGLAADLISRIYGDADPALTASITTGSLASGDSLAEITGTLARQAGENVGAYDVLLGSGIKASNYAITYVADNNAFMITQRAISLAADLVNRIYGDADPALATSITAGSLASGDTLAEITGALTREAGENVGAYDVLLGSGIKAGNYAITYTVDNNAFMITQRAISLAADLVSRIYGDADPALSVLVTGGSLASGDTLAEVTGGLTRQAGENVGAYDVLLGGGVKTGNYAITYAVDNNAFSITQRAISLAADLIGRTYGDADPALTASVTAGSLASSDTLAEVTGGLTRQAGENVGTYDVLLGSGIKAGNYAITYTVDNDAFSITQRAISVAADLIGRMYGDADPALTASITTGSLASGDSLTEVTGTLTRQTGENVGAYDVLLGSGIKAGNYAITYSADNNAFSITQRAISLAADLISRVYGDADPALSASITAGSLASGDSLAEVTGTLTRQTGENVGTYDVLLGSGIKAGNYAITYTADNNAFSITQRAIGLAADLVTRIYGNTDPALSASIITGSLASGDTLAEITGMLTREAGEDVGAYDVLLGTGAKAGNYAITYAVDNNAFSITQRAITLAADLVTRIYGDSDPTLSISVTAGSLAAGDTLADVAGTLARQAGENVGTYDVLLGSGIKAGNYAITYTVDNDAFSITQRAIGLAADLISRVYGDADPALTASITAGSLASGDTLAEITGSLTRQTGDDVGTYDVALGSGAKAGNYAITYTADNDAFSIAQRAISVAADLISRMYGDADPTLTASITAGSLASSDALAEITGTLTRQAGENVGSYDVLLGSGIKAGNYAITYSADNNAFAITQRAISLAADLVSRIYGNTDPALTASITTGSLASGDTLAEVTGTLTRQAGENVGAYDVLLGSGIKAGNYAITYTVDNNAFAIAQRAISLAADLVSRIYGETDPALGVSIAGGSLAAGDSLAEVTGGLTRQAGENVGSYDVLLGNGTKAGNYAITFVADNNAFSIAQRALSLAADLASRIYGDVDPELAASVIGGSLATGDTLAQVVGTMTRTPGENVGTYDVLLGSGVKAGNYAITFAVGNDAFSIRPAALVITANDQSRLYGDANAPLTLSYTGLRGADTLADVLASLPGASTAAAANSDVGRYAIDVAGAQLASGNYVVQFVAGTLEVRTRPITLAAASVSRLQGEIDPPLSVSIVEGDLADVDTLEELTGTLTRASGEAVGSYDVLLGQGAKAGNYAISYEFDNDAFAIRRHVVPGIVARAATLLASETLTSTTNALLRRDTLAIPPIGNYEWRRPWSMLVIEADLMRRSTRQLAGQVLDALSLLSGSSGAFQAAPR